MLRNYFTITKPGIIYGNAITVAGGFLLASRGVINYSLLISTLLGISLVIASGCVFNNYIDRDIDALMERTKDRALARGLIPLRSALIFGTILGVIGFLILLIFTNRLTALISLLGLFFYVIVYSMWSKRRNEYGTLVGSIAGAVPPVVGYLAVTNHFDFSALLLFLILAIWQMPHSYAIAIFRLDDYYSARIPVYPVARGVRTTKFHMLFWTILFLVATHTLHFKGYAGVVYLITISILSIIWLALSIRGFYTMDDKKWAKQMFMFSILILLIFSVLISFDFV